MATSTPACLEEVRKLRRQLCQNCRKVDLDDRSQGFKVTYRDGEPVGLEFVGEGHAKIPTAYCLTDDFPRLSKLEVSSRKGCSLCGYLRETMLSRHTRDFLEMHYGISTTSSGSLATEVTIGLSWILNIPFSGPNYLCANVSFIDKGRSFVVWSNVMAAPGSRDLANWLPIRAAPILSPSYPYNIEEMKARIQQCKRHSHALPSLDYAPERLLDVREDHPKLISGCGPRSEAQGRTPRYAALSYCWGTSKEATHQLTTTRQTMAERQSGIRYDEMPPVLRDAVNATKSLDIPFLWIDALCISQGDDADWEKHCAQMDNIYGHAEVTLVASSSNSCQDSFLRPEAPSTSLPFSSKRRPRFGGLLQVKFSGCTESSSSGEYYSDMNDSRLATRGWAVQERILSTRMIIFGRSNVQFVCASYSSQEDCRARGYLISRVRRADDESAHVYWTKLLDEYRTITVESFTRPTDLLPALSGLAAYFGSRTKDRYCAGHWQKTLYRSLIWCLAKPSHHPHARHVSRVCSRSPYVVPSWSRLGKGDSYALDQRLSGPTKEALNLDARISQTGENPFGAIRDALLEVRTHTMCLRSTTNIGLTTVVPVSDRHYYPDFWMLNFEQRDKSVLPSWARRGKHKFSCCVWLDYDLNKDSEEVRRDAEDWKWVLLGVSLKRPFGLLLSSVNDSKWCRVGVFAPSIYPGHACRSMRLRDFAKFSSVETVMII